MRIITTRKLRFYNKDRSETFVTAGSNIIEDCPDWAYHDSMFKAANAHGVLQIISSSQQLHKLEKDLVLPQNAHEAKEVLEESMEDVEMDNMVEDDEVIEDKPVKKNKKSRKKVQE